MMRLRFLVPIVLVAAACAPAEKKPAPAPTPSPVPSQPPTPTAEDAKAFTEKLGQDLRRLLTNSSVAEWIKSTYITDDTERNAATANEALLGYIATSIKEAAKFDGLKLDPETERMLYLLKVGSPLVAPSDPKKREELTTLAAKLEGMYGKGKYNGKDLQELEEILRTSRNYDQLLDAWKGWRTISVPMKPHYTRFVELANEGAREINFKNTGDLWRAAYDMPPEAFEKETDRLWQQVKPLYDDLHCYVRGKLSKKYAGKFPEDGTVPAHVLGNMWAQGWDNIYPLVEPFPGQSPLDISDALVKQKYDATKMTRLAESFFTSLGLDPLPPTFWERSMFVKPKDREVVCHASAWDVNYNNDLRIKMCIKPTEEDLVTLHHELGHDYYFQQYYKLPVLFQAGANDGFHEAIGDTIALSVTPGYYQQVGLLKSVPMNEKALINEQLKRALEKVAFLPFGKLIDQWRWDVFSGKTTPEHYNAAWWELVKKYQGVTPPEARGEEFFDPGAKYHVAANVPYTRYFLAHILQFQFHRALCKEAGQTGPLHECSIFGNKAAGEKLKTMLALGASKPWPDALEAVTGQREMDASAILEYFAPLHKWLKEQNAGQQCGWK
jgi:peptidyl-dipeptidase A